jgi:tRNA pseudouridine38-40 synthase
MASRYFIELSFKGTHYHGWQIQPNAIAVQQLVDEAFTTFLREKIETLGAGRTDAGVHANYFVAHFDSQRDDLHKDASVLKRANLMLPHDISINSIVKMHTDAHARFDALSRRYEYHICLDKDPFKLEFAHYLHEIPDMMLMNKGAALIKKATDFTSFSKRHTDNKTNFCKISYSKWEQKEQMLVFTIEADRFLRNMVRAIVGTLLDLGRGKITIGELKNIIDSKDRCKAGNSVPPQGLYLTAITYPADYKLSGKSYKSY